MANAAQLRRWMEHHNFLQQYIELRISTEIDMRSAFTTSKCIWFSNLGETAEKRDAILFTPTVE